MKKNLVILILGFGTFASTAVFAMEEDEVINYTIIFKFLEGENEEKEIGIPEKKIENLVDEMFLSEDISPSLGRKVSDENAYPVSILNKIIRSKVNHRDSNPISSNKEKCRKEDSYY